MKEEREISRPLTQLVTLEKFSVDPDNLMNTDPESPTQDPPQRPSRSAAQRTMQPAREWCSSEEETSPERDAESSMDRPQTDGPRRPSGGGADLPGRFTSWATMMLLGLLCLLCRTAHAVDQTATRLSCIPGGIRLDHEAHFPRYHLCAESECVTVEPSARSSHEEHIFSRATTAADYDASVKYEDAGRIRVLSESCEAYDFCQSLDCTLCIELMLNPECSPKTAIAVLGLLLYGIGVMIVALCCTPVLLGSPCVACVWLSTALLRRCLKGVLQFGTWLLRCRRENRARAPRRQRVDSEEEHELLQRSTTTSRRYSSSRAFIVLCALATVPSSAMGCQQVVDLSAVQQRCEAQECHVLQNVMLKINPIAREACLVMTSAGGVVGQVRLSLDEANLRCVKRGLGLHYDGEVKVRTAKRCPRTGSCREGKCLAVETQTHIAELKEANRFPGHTYCSESCGGLGCQCLFPSSGCLFYRTYVKPRSNYSYETFECQEWRPAAQLTIDVQMGEKQTRGRLTLFPNVQETYEGMSFTLTTFSQPYMSVLQSKFIGDGGERVGLLKKEPILNCDTPNTDVRNCTATEKCTCTPAEDDAVCVCEQVELEDNFNVENVLPLRTPSLKMYLATSEQEPRISLLESISMEIFLTVDLKRWQMTAQKAERIKCSVESEELDGCYNCRKGAKTLFTCVADKVGLATVTCERDSFTISCDPEGTRTERRLYYSQARVREECKVSCGEPVEVAGRLKYAGSLLKADWRTLRSTQWNETTVDWPDLGHSLGVLLEHWLWAAATGLAVALGIIISVLVIGPCLPSVGARCVMACWQGCLLFKRRGKTAKAEDKIL